MNASVLLPRAQRARSRAGETQSGRLARSAWLIYLGCTTALVAGYGLAHLSGPSWLRSGLVFNLIGGLSVAARRALNTLFVKRMSSS